MPIGGERAAHSNATRHAQDIKGVSPYLGPPHSAYLYGGTIPSPRLSTSRVGPSASPSYRAAEYVRRYGVRGGRQKREGRAAALGRAVRRGEGLVGEGTSLGTSCMHHTAGRVPSLTGVWALHPGKEIRNYSHHPAHTDSMIVRLRPWSIAIVRLHP